MPNVGPEDPCGVIRKNPREEALKTTSYHKKYHTVGTFHTPAWYLAFFFFQGVVISMKCPPLILGI